jgi:hypothetical protein
METTTMEHAEKTMEHTVIGGASTEAMTGAAAIVLAILGLANIAPLLMVTVSSIALGASLILDGAAVATEYSRILSHNGNGAIQSAELGGGISSQIGGGVAGVVLGVLALVNINPMVLMPIAAIVLGATTVFSSSVSTRLNALKIETSGDHDIAKRVAREALTSATGMEVLVGLAAIVLGILSLVGLAPLTLTLVSMLALGASILLTGTAVIGKMLSVFAT